MKKYEALVILPGSLNDEGVEKAIEGIRGHVEKVKGVVTGATRLGRRAFARPMKKQDNGYYVGFLFEADPQAISRLQARFKLDEGILRVQVVLAGARPAAAERGEGEREGTEKAEKQEHGEEGGRDGEPQ